VLPIRWPRAGRPRSYERRPRSETGNGDKLPIVLVFERLGDAR
jgi:hypothetical protein